MKKIELSIIVVNYNTNKLTKDCVNSIIKYTKNISYEIIVVDNNSTTKPEINLPRVKIIFNNENLGFSKANNIGIRQSKGSYVALLNSDTLLIDNSLEKLYEFAKSDEKIGIVGARLLNKDKTLQSSVFRFPTIGKAILQYWLGKKGLLDKYAPVSNLPTKVDAVVAAAIVITPQAIKKVGLLDERYFMFYEDIDYCKRAKKSGLDVYYYPDAKIIHYHGASAKRGDDSWRNLIPSSKIYNGTIKHYIYNSILWSGQKLRKIF